MIPVATGAEAVRFLEQVRTVRLDNGLTLALLVSRQASLVTTALAYRAGSRDEPAGQAGIAHFLEHMMFKGSPRFGPGEVDRVTQAHGGSNNAFTTHDATVYHFSFASTGWESALDMEADRMAALVLDPAEVAAERQVIREEIAAYRNDPWEHLAALVQRRVFGRHPYGRPILGEKAQLASVGTDELASFHRRFYRPANAVLVLAGDLPPDALERAADRFGKLPAGAGERPVRRPPRARQGLARLTVAQAEVPRLLLAFPVPGADHPDYPVLRVLAGVLGGSRSSRLYRRFVDEGQSCSSASVDLLEMAEAGALEIALEVIPGVEPARVEDGLLSELARVAAGELETGEVERARRILEADWLFAHERIQQQALTVGWALTLFDLGYPGRQLAGIRACDRERLREVAAARLDAGRGAVLGWSLPRARRRPLATARRGARRRAPR